MGLHYILQHLDHLGIYTRNLFVDLSSVFNTIIPEILSSKLSQLTGVDHQLPDRQETAGALGGSHFQYTDGQNVQFRISSPFFSPRTSFRTSTNPASNQPIPLKMLSLQ